MWWALVEEKWWQWKQKEGSVVETQYHFFLLHNCAGPSRHNKTYMLVQRSVDLQRGSGVCKWGFYGVRSRTTAHYVYQPSSAGRVRVLLLIPPVVSYSLWYCLFFRPRTPTPLLGFSLSPLTSRNIVSVGKKSTRNSHLQQTARHGGSKCGLTGMSRGQMLI